MLVVLRCIDLTEQDLFMIKADAVRGHFHVKKADVADQRLSSLVFTPGADDLHTRSARAKLMPNVLMNNQRTPCLSSRPPFNLARLAGCA